jgi:glycosyltransferase involved in cell wall biosynthesis
MTTRTLSVIIPCYNEAATIGEVVARVQRAPLPPGWQREVIVVDDGSGPETKEALRSLESAVRLVYRPQNGGKGAAVKDGLRVARGDFCLIQDADLELDPAQYGELLAPVVAGSADTVFGYRVLHAGTGRPALFYGGLLLTRLFNLVFFTKFRDIACAYKVMPRGKLSKVLALPSDDFVFDSIELTHALGLGQTVAQVPVVYTPRSKAGGKKLTPVDGVRCALALGLLRIGLYRPGIARETGNIARFLFAGAAAVAVHLGVLFGLVELYGVGYLTASVGGFLSGYLASFVLQKFWTFKDRRIYAISYQLPLHFGLALFNLGLNVVLMLALVEGAGLWYLAAQLCTTSVVMVVSYLVSRMIFSPSKRA